MSHQDTGKTTCAACLGSLGLFGNSLFQIAFCQLLADAAGLRLQVPARWRWRGHFQSEPSWDVVSDEHAWALPVAADRVVLSHPGFKVWIAKGRQYRELAAALRGGGCGGSGGGDAGAEAAAEAAPALSGRQLRRSWPQVSAADLAPPPAAATAAAGTVSGTAGGAADGVGAAAPSGASERGGSPGQQGAKRARREGAAGGTECAAGGGGRDPSPRRAPRQQPGSAAAGGGAAAAARADIAGRGLWGWFQFETSAYAPHRERIRELWRLKQEPQLRAALRLALHIARGGAAAHEGGSGGGGSGGGGVEEDCDGGEGQRGGGDSAAGVTGAAGRRRGRLVVVHVRRGDQPELTTGSGGGSSGGDGGVPPPLQQQQQQQQQQPSRPTLREQPPFEESQGDAWDGQGCDWRAPAEWLAAALESLQLDGASGDVLWVCSDDAELAARPGLLLSQLGGAELSAPVVSWESVMEAAACGEGGEGGEGGGGVDDGGGGACCSDGEGGGGGGGGGAGAGQRVGASDEEAFACVRGDPASGGGGGGAAVVSDWFCMSQADVLIASNSTLSFTAGMACEVPGARFLRPDPRVCAYVEFDPWRALPLLPARGSLPANHSIHRAE